MKCLTTKPETNKLYEQNIKLISDDREEVSNDCLLLALLRHAVNSSPSALVCVLNGIAKKGDRNKN